MFLILFILVGLIPVGAVAQDSAVMEYLFEPMDAKRSRRVPVKVYLPKTDIRLPVVIFSHGLGGSREGNPYLGRYWAKAGYVAVFTQHAGSDNEVWKAVKPSERLGAMKGAANLQNTIARFRDVPFVIDELEVWNAEVGHPLAGKLDLEKIGMSGHSYGAVTTQALMGQKFPVEGIKFDEPRIDAFILMSPSGSKGMSPAEAFGEVRLPVLAMTGTADTSVIDRDVTPENRMSIYLAMPEGDKYHLVFQDGKHNAFSDDNRYNPNRVEHHHPAIQKITTKFWDAYLKGKTEAKSWLQSERPRKGAGLVEKDRWEWK